MRFHWGAKQHGGRGALCRPGRACAHVPALPSGLIPLKMQHSDSGDQNLGAAQLPGPTQELLLWTVLFPAAPRAGEPDLVQGQFRMCLHAVGNKCQQNNRTLCYFSDTVL